jgi:small subunit ribosomal protein S21
MIVVEVKKSLDSALKEFKGKVIKTKLVQELRERQTYTKKSVKRRNKILKAKWIQQNTEEENI